MQRANFHPVFLLLAVILLQASSGSSLAQTGTYADARSGGNYMHNFYFPPAPSSSPWAPDWSPDGEWIAIAMQGSIWKVEPQTGIAY